MTESRIKMNIKFGVVELSRATSIDLYIANKKRTLSKTVRRNRISVIDRMIAMMLTDSWYPISVIEGLRVHSEASGEFRGQVHG